MMEDLIERLEKAEAGSRGLSDEVLLALGGSIEEWSDGSGTTRVLIPPDRQSAWLLDDRQGLSRPSPTTDMNAALALVPEGWHVDCLSTGDPDVRAGNKAGKPRCILRPNLMSDDAWASSGPQFCNGAATPALALCAAVLRARAALRSSREG